MPEHCHNRFLPYILQCLMEQTDPDWEWVVVDNSPDQYFQKWLDSMKLEQDILNKIHVHFTPNVGCRPGWYKMIGAGMANCGEDGFIMWLDHDDLIFPTLVENVNDIARKHPECEMVTANWTSIIWEEGQMIKYNTKDDWMNAMWNGHSMQWLDVGDLLVYTYDNHGFNAMAAKSSTFPTNHPKIIRKRAVTEHRMVLSDVNSFDDEGIYELCSLMLPEVYIDDIQYCFVIHNEDKLVIHSSWNRSNVDDPDFIEENDVKDRLDMIFSKKSIRKRRIPYEPRERICPRE